ncbi:MAG TPA: hypothetical protein VKA91_04725 [Nitrososphaeraceae archaeon]|nr:hypothetical protein [Nitrososphaeraceae archaeon]
MIVAESLLRALVKLHRKHVDNYDGGIWDPKACYSLISMHRLHTSFETYHRKNI